MPPHNRYSVVTHLTGSGQSHRSARVAVVGLSHGRCAPWAWAWAPVAGLPSVPVVMGAPADARPGAGPVRHGALPCCCQAVHGVSDRARLPACFVALTGRGTRLQLGSKVSKRVKGLTKSAPQCHRRGRVR